MMAMISLQNNQTRENHALAEKLAALDFEKTLIAAMADGNVCKYVLNNPTIRTFDSTALPQTIAFTTPLYTSVTSGTPGPVLVQTTVPSPVSPIANSVVPNSIALVISSGSGSSYVGSWVVGFDGSKLLRPIKPAFAGVILTVDSSQPTLAKITGCQGNGSSPPPAGLQYLGSCSAPPNCSAGTATTCKCNLGEKIMMLEHNSYSFSGACDTVGQNTAAVYGQAGADMASDCRGPVTCVWSCFK